LIWLLELTQRTNVSRVSPKSPNVRIEILYFVLRTFSVSILIWLPELTR